MSCYHRQQIIIIIIIIFFIKSTISSSTTNDRFKGYLNQHIFCPINCEVILQGTKIATYFNPLNYCTAQFATVVVLGTHAMNKCQK